MSAPSGPGPDAVELPVQPLRRARGQLVASALQDGPAAYTLLLAGAAGVRAPRGGTDLVLALVELAVAAVVLRFIVRGGAELFARRGPAPRDDAPAHTPEVPTLHAGEAPWRVRWEGVAVGSMALVEALHHWHLTGQMKRPTLLTGLITVALALGGAAAIERRAGRRRRSLVVSREGVRYRGGPRHRHQFAARWNEVDRVEHAPGALRVVLHGGHAWTLHAHEHLDGAALVRAAWGAVAAHGPARLAPPGVSPP